MHVVVVNNEVVLGRLRIKSPSLERGVIRAAAAINDSP